MSQLSQTPVLPSLAERDATTSQLFERLAAADSPRASDQVAAQIVDLYLDVCSAMAARHEGHGIEHEDLVRVARLALLQAVRRYEPGHAPSFAAFVVPAISGALRRWLRQISPLHVRPSSPAPGQPVSGIVSPRLSPDSALRTDDPVCLAEALTVLDDDERELLLRRYAAGLSPRDPLGSQAAGPTGVAPVSRAPRRITGDLKDCRVVVSDAPALGRRVSTAPLLPEPRSIRTSAADL